MLIVSLCITFVLWNVGGHAGEETLKYIQAFRKSPRFSFTLPLNQLRENSCLPDFTDKKKFLHFAHKWTEREFMSPWLYRYFFYLHFAHKWTEREFMSPWLYWYFFFFLHFAHNWTERKFMSPWLYRFFLFSSLCPYIVSELRENSCLPDFTDIFFFFTLPIHCKWTEREFMSPWLYR